MSGIDDLVSRVRAQMELDSETECEVLAEIRDHLEDSLAEARAMGLGEPEALAQVAARFGVGEEIGQDLQAVPVGWPLRPMALPSAGPASLAGPRSGSSRWQPWSSPCSSLSAGDMRSLPGLSSGACRCSLSPGRHCAGRQYYPGVDRWPRAAQRGEPFQASAPGILSLCASALRDLAFPKPGSASVRHKCRPELQVSMPQRLAHALLGLISARFAGGPLSQKTARREVMNE